MTWRGLEVKQSLVEPAGFRRSRLSGGSGDDELHGGGGDDLFYFDESGGQNEILDFHAGEGSEDRIDVSDFNFANLSDLLAVTHDGRAAIIQLDDDTSIKLVGVRAADLHEDDFIFS